MSSHRQAPVEPKRIVVAGSVMVDLLMAPLSRIPRWDENAFVETVHLHVGGLAANAAVCLAHLGAPVDVVARLGDDPFGEMIHERLQTAGVNCQHLGRDACRSTSLAFGFVGEQGQRLFVVSLGANASLSQRDFQRINWKNVGFLHLGGFFHLPGVESELHKLLPRIRRRSVQISLDLAWDPNNRWMEPLRPLLPHLDFIFPNEKQTQRLTGQRVVRQGAQILREAGVRAVIVKLGARGCYVDGDAWQGFVSAFPVQVVDTTGAGDNFDAAFLYGLQTGWNLQTCARFASVVAAASTRAYGAAAALPSRAEAERWMKEFYE